MIIGMIGKPLKEGKEMNDKKARIAAMTLGIASALGGPYSEQFPFKRLKWTNIQHREICPCCGKTLVNLYYKCGEWKCKECWGKEETE